MNTKLIIRYAFRETMGLVIMGVALFWSAGRIDWLPAWAALVVMFAWSVATAIIILHLNPALLVERLEPRKGAKKWDTAIMSVLGLTQLIRYIVAGLDQRYNWTGGFPIVAQISAFIMCFWGYALVAWATASNAFFSQIVRLQPDRNHSVIKSDPYRFIRHPAYVGAMVYELSVPILLASWWAFIPSTVCICLLILRTFLEDRTLLIELNGYDDYARQVRFRLFPGLW